MRAIDTQSTFAIGDDTWWPERKKIGGRKHFDLSVVSLSAFTYPTQRPQPQQPSDLVVAAALDPFVFGQSLGNVDPQQQPLCVEGYKMSPPPPLYSTLLQRESVVWRWQVGTKDSSSSYPAIKHEKRTKAKEKRSWCLRFGNPTSVSKWRTQLLKIKRGLLMSV